jgi:hypothetical protein
MMIHKVYQKSVAVLALAGCLSMGSAPSLCAMELGIGGRLTRATPFDNKLNSTGTLAGIVPVQNVQSADSLFNKAKTFRYVADDPSKDYWQTPQETESRWAGDCEDKAVWLFAQLKKNGYRDVRLVVGHFNRASHGYHVWVTLTDESSGRVCVLDPTSQKRIWKSEDFAEGYYKPLYSFDGSNRYRHDV